MHPSARAGFQECARAYQGKVVAGSMLCEILSWRAHARPKRRTSAGMRPEFRLEVLLSCVYCPIMANAPSMELLTSSGVDPKTAKALGEFVEKAVDSSVEKAMKSFVAAAESRPRESTQSSGSKAVIVLTGIMAAAAVVTVQLGAIYWLSDTIRSEISDVRGEISDVRGEISELRSDVREDLRSFETKVEAKFDELWAEIGEIRAEIGEIRAEIGEIRERLTRIEVVVEDRLPAAP